MVFWDSNWLSLMILGNLSRIYPSCWGGKVVLEGCLVEGLGDIVKCGVACHPGAFDLGKHSYPEVFKKQSKPMLYCLAEIDREISPKQVEEIKEICVKNSEGKDDGFQTAILYPGTLHGFAARGEDFNPAVKAARQDALERQFEFFKKHL